MYVCFLVFWRCGGVLCSGFLSPLPPPPLSTPLPCTIEDVKSMFSFSVFCQHSAALMVSLLPRCVKQHDCLAVLTLNCNEESTFSFCLWNAVMFIFILHIYDDNFNVHTIHGGSVCICVCVCVCSDVSICHNCTQVGGATNSHTDSL